MLRDSACSGLLTLALVPGFSGMELAWVVAGIILAIGICRLISHPRRNLGLVPPGWTGLLGLLIWAAVDWSATSIVSGLFLALTGFCLSLIVIPLIRQAVRLRSRTQPPGNARLRDAHVSLLIGCCLAILLLLLAPRWVPIVRPLLIAGTLLGLGLTGFLLSWIVLYPQTIELIVAAIMLPFYRVHLHGPGKDRLPLEGPLLIVSNHASYLDPFWIGKVLPCHVRPLMTAAFYDRPLIRWLMVHVVEAIRMKSGLYRGKPDGTEETSLLQRVPELKTAVAALKAGACLLVFPEGKLRRTEPILLSPFGQGVWHILNQRPETPVVTIWIEGSWGSWASYYGGPPLQNKKLDRARRIDVVVSEPRPLPPSILAGHRETRAELSRRVLELRKVLGLPESRFPAPPSSLPNDREVG